jgi:hypothetical protein
MLNSLWQLTIIELPELAHYINMKISVQVFLLFLASCTFAATDPRVKVALTLQHPVNGVSTTPNGRIFILYARVDGSTGPTSCGIA